MNSRKLTITAVALMLIAVMAVTPALATNVFAVKKFENCLTRHFNKAQEVNWEIVRDCFNQQFHANIK